MKKYIVYSKLRELFRRVQFHEKVPAEIMELVVGTGIEKQFLLQFEKNLDILQQLGMNAVQHNNFEKLKSTDNLYSMKFRGKNMNLRMLYSYDTFTNTIILHCFYERDDSGTDRYDEHIPIAVERKKEMEKYEK